MSVGATSWVFENSPYKGVELLLHVAIADTVGPKNGWCFYGEQAWLAKKTRTSRQTVNKFIAQAVADGFLELMRERPGRSNMYKFRMPQGVATDDTPGSVEVTPPVATDDRGVATDDTLIEPRTKPQSEHIWENPEAKAKTAASVKALARKMKRVDD